MQHPPLTTRDLIWYALLSAFPIDPSGKSRRNAKRRTVNEKNDLTGENNLDRLFYMRRQQRLKDQRRAFIRGKDQGGNPTQRHRNSAEGNPLLFGFLFHRSVDYAAGH